MRLHLGRSGELACSRGCCMHQVAHSVAFAVRTFQFALPGPLSIPNRLDFSSVIYLSLALFSFLLPASFQLLSAPPSRKPLWLQPGRCSASEDTYAGQARTAGSLSRAEDHDPLSANQSQLFKWSLFLPRPQARWAECSELQSEDGEKPPEHWPEPLSPQQPTEELGK